MFILHRNESCSILNDNTKQQPAAVTDEPVGGACVHQLRVLVKKVQVLPVHQSDMAAACFLIQHGNMW